MWTRSWRRNQKLLGYRAQMKCQRCGPRWGPLVTQRPAVGCHSELAGDGRSAWGCIAASGTSGDAQSGAGGATVPGRE
eukprot:2755065-Rhodomonas_salina.1